MALTHPPAHTHSLPVRALCCRYPEVLTKILNKSARRAWPEREHKMIVMGRYLENRAPVFRYMVLHEHHHMFHGHILYGGNCTATSTLFLDHCWA